MVVVTVDLAVYQHSSKKPKDAPITPLEPNRISPALLALLAFAREEMETEHLSTIDPIASAECTAETHSRSVRK
ncbi:hypothetical protein E2P81_ATG04818 [Venturia nashicola]|nr:hypothetical protein E2P81_ATG04818 [Venturia nashicola]